jgi:hypothetical protein
MQAKDQRALRRRGQGIPDRGCDKECHRIPRPTGGYGLVRSGAANGKFSAFGLPARVPCRPLPVTQNRGTDVKQSPSPQ